ncbi:MAG TPA: hypothetical protein VIV58_30230, partial [Kofleriaceae bacterium]
MTTEALNARRFRDQPGTYEVWYLTWNHPATGQGFWLRFVLEAPMIRTLLSQIAGAAEPCIPVEGASMEMFEEEIAMEKKSSSFG